MSVVDAKREVRVTEGDNVILAEVGEVTPDSFTVFAIGFKADKHVSNEAIIKLYEGIAELAGQVEGVELHTQGRVAVMAYEAALRLTLDVETARAAHQAGTS